MTEKGRKFERLLTLYQMNMDVIQKLEHIPYPQAGKATEKALDNLLIILDKLEV